MNTSKGMPLFTSKTDRLQRLVVVVTSTGRVGALHVILRYQLLSLAQQCGVHLGILGKVILS